jgi:hypothetical protein
MDLVIERAKETGANIPAAVWSYAPPSPDGAVGDMPEHREQSEKSNQECWAAR